MVNELKRLQTLLVGIMNTDPSITDADFAATEEDDATSLATAYTLLNDFKTKHRAILAKLDLDAEVDDTNFEATMALAEDDATTVATLVALVYEASTKFGKFLRKIEGDCGAGFIQYCELGSDFFILPLITTFESGATQQASEAINHLWQVGLTAGVTANAVHAMEFSSETPVIPGTCFVVEIATPVDADGDVVDILIN